MTALPIPAQGDPATAALRTANVQLTVTEFHPILQSAPAPQMPAPRSMKPGAAPAPNVNTLAEMTMPEPHSRVFIDRDAPGVLKVRPRGATIRFTIAPARYFPVGIAFQLIKGEPNPTNLDRIGKLNFEQSRTPRDPNALFVTDCFKDEDDDDLYKFSVVVQDMHTGQIGVIDPGIQHVP